MKLSQLWAERNARNEACAWRNG